DPALAKLYSGATAKRLGKRLAASLDTVMTALSHEEPCVRSSAAFCMAFVPGAGSKAEEALRARLREEEDPTVRASLWVALGLCARASNSALPASDVRDAPALATAARVLARLLATPGALEGDDVTTLATAMMLGDQGADAWPWKAGRVDATITRTVMMQAGTEAAADVLLRALSDVDADAVSARKQPGVVRAWPPEPADETDGPIPRWMLGEWAGAVAQLELEVHPGLRAPDTLTARQRHVVERLARSQADGGAAFAQRGLPPSLDLARYIGVAPSGRLELPLGDAAHAYLLLQGPPAPRDALLQGLQVPALEKLELLGEILEGRYGLRAGDPGVVLSVAHEVGDPAVPWAQELAPRLAATKSANTNVVLAVLVRAGAALGDLAPCAQFFGPPDLTREVFAAAPDAGERCLRDALVSWGGDRDRAGRGLPHWLKLTDGSQPNPALVAPLLDALAPLVSNPGTFGQVRDQALAMARALAGDDAEAHARVQAAEDQRAGR
ncbi:MAG: hypothetical protein KC668_22200, partial [Myxococcales bacterium]|nr:hypothetical protein [Myxococcales bacterium]